MYHTRLLPSPLGRTTRFPEQLLTPLAYAGNESSSKSATLPAVLLKVSDDQKTSLVARNQ